MGDKIKPQTTARRKPYYAGVGENTIKLVWSNDEANCGVNVVSRAHRGRRRAADDEPLLPRRRPRRRTASGPRRMKRSTF